MFPATGSTRMAASESAFASHASATASRSLKGTRCVWRTVSAGTPGLEGEPNVVAPLPAATSRPSTWPW